MPCPAPTRPRALSVTLPQGMFFAEVNIGEENKKYNSNSIQFSWSYNTYLAMFYTRALKNFDFNAATFLESKYLET